MRRGWRAVAVPLMLLTLSACRAVEAQTATQRLRVPLGVTSQAWSFERDGWTYVHLEGTPREIGYQHGYLLKDAIEDNLSVYQLENQHDLGKDWAFFREAGRTVLWPHINDEYRAELEGIAEGMKAAGSAKDVWDVVALNGILELSEYYLPMLNEKEGKPNPAKAVAPGKCSAFIATGKATKDGKIVIAHSNWSSYAEGERWTVVFDIVPRQGNRILMDGTPGVITSQDDFGVNSAGLMITETTLPMAKGFDVSGIPEFVRSRRAMQYAGSIDEYVAILREGNNGGYANSWMVGDRKTGEIAYLELGLKNTPLLRKKSGYFVSSNFAANPDLIRDDTPGFNPKNLSSSMNARHLRATEFLQQQMGRIDVKVAEAYLSDHEDSFEHRERADQRSLCGHEEQASEGEPVWGSPPFAPNGAVTGKVMTAAMAEKMSFVARAGHPCGQEFFVEPFLASHPEFAWQKPILRNLEAGPWATFASGEKAH
ncbi:MAG: hypothetical protein NVSMB3_07230 [Acidobacteriaceae bacterium]